MPLVKTFQQLCAEAKTRIPEITTDELEARRTSPDFSGVIIDVREQDEFRGGHIPGARGIGRGILEYHIADEVPDTETEILLYCRGGNRSALAADSLRQMGYTNVHSMTGGWRQWSEEGKPVSFDGEPIVH
ncbi:MAG: rhodanese-like domain-containing protein [Armatimonadaceae bacterium]